MIIRSIAPSDPSEIVEVYLPAWLSAYPNQLNISELPTEEVQRLREGMTKNWVGKLADPKNRLWMAYEDKQSEGFVQLTQLDADTYKISALYVQPDKQSTGVGSELLKTALNDVPAHKRVELEVAQGYAPLTRFYERHGFRVTGNVEPSPIRNYPARNSVPAYRMELTT